MRWLPQICCTKTCLFLDLRALPQLQIQWRVRFLCFKLSKGLVAGPIQKQTQVLVKQKNFSNSTFWEIWSPSNSSRPHSQPESSSSWLWPWWPGWPWPAWPAGWPGWPGRPPWGPPGWWPWGAWWPPAAAASLSAAASSIPAPWQSLKCWSVGCTGCSKKLSRS